MEIIEIIDKELSAISSSFLCLGSAIEESQSVRREYESISEYNKLRFILNGHRYKYIYIHTHTHTHTHTHIYIHISQDVCACFFIPCYFPSISIIIIFLLFIHLFVNDLIINLRKNYKIYITKKKSAESVDFMLNRYNLKI